MSEAKEVSESVEGLSLVCPYDIVFCHVGDDVILLCNLHPAISAVSMEIKWWFRADLVCHYKDGQVMENYEGRASLSVEELHNGNVSLTLRDVRSLQKGLYFCEVNDQCHSLKEFIFLHIRSENFSLVVPPDPVSAEPGEDVVLPVHLSTEINAENMEIRWYRRMNLIYHYRNRRQQITNSDLENRVSLSNQELERGNVSLTLRNAQRSDSGNYLCIVFHDGCLQTGTVQLEVREHRKKIDKRSKNLQDMVRKIHEDHLQQKTNIEETLKLLQEALENAEKDEKKEDETSVVLGPTPRRSNSTEGIRPLMEEESRTETLLLEGPTPRRSNSTDGIRPLMEEESRTETPLLEVERESQAQHTRQTREGNSELTVSILRQQRERTSANQRTSEVQERIPGTVRITQSFQQVRPPQTEQSQERERTSQSAGDTSQTPERPRRDRTQTRPNQTEKDCKIL